VHFGAKRRKKADQGGKEGERGRDGGGHRLSTRADELRLGAIVIPRSPVRKKRS